MSDMWRDLWTDVPPLGEAARQARASLTGGDAFHLALVTHLCNQRHPGRSAPTCRGCRHLEECGRDVDAALVFAVTLGRGCRAN